MAEEVTGTSGQQAYQAPTPQPPANKGKGLGIAALVLGALAALLSFVPFINILALPLALVGLILGLIAAIQARGKRGPIGFGIAGIICSVVAIAITIIMYVVAAVYVSNHPDEINDIINQALTSDASPSTTYPSSSGTTTSTERESASTTSDTSASTASAPQEISDSEIEQIETYNDYLVLFEKIVDNYFASYELMDKEAGSYNENGIENLEQIYDILLEDRKEAYGSKGDQKLVEKEALVEDLIKHRDILQSLADAVNGAQ
ncbi:MAG: hypothetical protein LBP24_05065 [Coriobacteriales bacterium]|nr:hypothetical protein [Coriobacteriales bacterium]